MLCNGWAFELAAQLGLRAGPPVPVAASASAFQAEAGSSRSRIRRATASRAALRPSHAMALPAPTRRSLRDRRQETGAGQEQWVKRIISLDLEARFNVYA